MRLSRGAATTLASGAWRAWMIADPMGSTKLFAASGYKDTRNSSSSDHCIASHATVVADTGVALTTIGGSNTVTAFFPSLIVFSSTYSSVWVQFPVAVSIAIRRLVASFNFSCCVLGQ
jgi:hypothetical protein